MSSRPGKIPPVILVPTWSQFGRHEEALIGLAPQIKLQDTELMRETL